MKFKSTITDIPTLAKITHSLSLLSKQAWLRLTPDSIQFIVQPSGTQVWATLDASTLFSSYFLESNANNVINLDLNPDLLSKLLRSMAGTRSQVTMKLTKRDRFPMLSFTSQYFGSTHGGVNTITHDLHVRVLSAHFMAQLIEPQIPPPDVVIVLPPLSQLGQISSGLKGLSDRLIVAASSAGRFTIGIATPGVTTCTVFKDLANPVLDTGSNDNDNDDNDDDNDEDENEAGEGQGRGRDKEEYCRMKVDAKDWCNLLKIGAVAKRVVACFCKDHALVLYVYVSEEEEDGGAQQQQSILTYYIATFLD